jgi:hypothetical protein
MVFHVLLVVENDSVVVLKVSESLQPVFTNSRVQY